MDEDIFEVKKWIQFAHEDYKSAVARAKTVGNPYSPRQVCYDCQQAAEKILKAYTIAKDGARNKEHRLDVLLISCRQHSEDFDTPRSRLLNLKRTYNKITLSVRQRNNG
ncbi:hypothetical protein R80B4_03254 [Fibrobacteres bacterium R8-0-B4]